MRTKKNVANLEELEIQAAASILIYDTEEVETFLDLYNGTVQDNQLGTSGPFAKFLEIASKAVKEGLFDSEDREDLELEDGIVLKGITREERLMNYIIKSGDLLYDSKGKDKFNSWFSQVINSNVEESLAEDLMHMYLWENYKNSINIIDQSEESFREKLSSTPKKLEIKDSKSMIVKLSDIDIEADNDSNRYYTTGLENLDETIQLKGTNLMIIAARPGVGKSLFMLQQAVENARGGKVIGVDNRRLKPKKTLFISLEMSEKSIHDRILSYVSGSNMSDYTEEEYKKKANEIKSSDEYKNIMENLLLMTTTSSNGTKILDDIEVAIEDLGIENVYLDYLQLLKFPGKDEWGSIREATNSLKNLAFRRNILMVTGSQVSRASEGEGLALSDLFGGSSIEADADCVVGMESLTERRASDKNRVNIKTLKNREGSLGTYKFMIDYSYGQIDIAAE